MAEAWRVWVLVCVLGVQAVSARAQAGRIGPAPDASQVGVTGTGFYFGPHVGAGRAAVREATPLIGVSEPDLSGLLFGSQFGYRFVRDDRAFGIEIDHDRAQVRGAAFCPNRLFQCVAGVRQLATVRGVLGVAVDSLLFYVTGGLAYSESRYGTVPLARLPASATAGATGLFTAYRTGHVVGAGLEFPVNRTWRARMEYLHYGFDASDAPRGTLAIVSPVRIDLAIDVVRIGFSRTIDLNSLLRR